ncbi:MAG: PEP-CTERM sorting domain-containing protein [Bryobacteraceae bacterium]
MKTSLKCAWPAREVLVAGLRRLRMANCVTTWPAVAALLLLPATAGAETFFADSFYVGVEDINTPCGSNSDCDYNDVIFSLAGAGLSLHSGGMLFDPFQPDNSGSPFWNNLSNDSAHANFGNCLYSSGANNTCGPNDSSASPIAPNAKYLASAGKGSVDFYFSTDGQVTVTFLASIAAIPDRNLLYWCPAGTSVSGGPGSTCQKIGINGSNATATFTPGGAFDLVLYRSSSAGGLVGPYDSETGVGGVANSSTNHFAVAFTPVPEPATLGMAGAALAILGLWRRRSANTGARSQ